MIDEESMENVKKIVRPTEKTLDDQISKIATAMGVDKDSVVRMAVKNFTSKNNKSDNLEKYMNLYEKTKDMPIKDSGSGMPSMQDMLMFKMMGGIEKEEKNSNGIDMEKMMSYQLLKSMFAPNPMEMMMYMNMFKGDEKSDKSDIFRDMMQQQQQGQPTLMAAIFGKERIDSTAKLTDIENKNSQQSMQSRLDFAEKILPQIAKFESKLDSMENSGGRSMVDEMKEFMQFQGVMKEFAKEQGYTKSGGEGGVDWAKLATQILGMGKEAVSKIPASTPPQKQMQPIQKIIPQSTKGQPKPTVRKENITPAPNIEPSSQTFTEPLIAGTTNKKPKK